jgi:hypothetical protein
MRSGVRSAFRLAKKSARADEGDALAGEEICQQTKTFHVEKRRLTVGAGEDNGAIATIGATHSG